MDPVVRLAIVLGTYNRLVYLRECVKSIRDAVVPAPGGTGLHPIDQYKIIVVDGGSTDGSREWLAEQRDVIPIGQTGPLTGAVVAFNLGFGLAVDSGYEYIANGNDDAFYATPGMLAYAVTMLDRDLPLVPQTADQWKALGIVPPDYYWAQDKAAPFGAVAFHFDLPGRPDGFEYINGLPYANFGVTRREVGMAVARAQGDPLGRRWWNPIYHTYGADSEFGAWIWRLGYQILPAPGLKIHDAQAMDDLRRGNTESPRRLEDGRRFWRRWPSREHILRTGPVIE